MIRFRLPWKWVPSEEAPAVKKETTKRVVSKEQRREGIVLGRNARWRQIKDHPRHRDAVTMIGPVSEMGRMTIEDMRRNG